MLLNLPTIHGKKMLEKTYDEMFELLNENERVGIMDKDNSMYQIYADLEKLVGKESMRKIHEQYKGQHVIFPQRIYKSEYVQKYISENPNELLSSIAKKFNYSERWVRQLKSKNNRKTIC